MPLKSIGRALRGAGEIVAEGLADVAHSLVGNWNWQPPLWLAQTAQYAVDKVRLARSRPRHTLILAALVAALLSGGYFAYKWWQARPKPLLITYTIKAPERTKIEEKGAKPDTVVIEFSHPAAPLQNIGKAVQSGITMTPLSEGEWFWRDDTHLEFVPKNDWAIGQKYAINFATRGFFAPEVKLDKYAADFTSAAFNATIGEAEHYEDPVNPTQKKVVVNVSFTHPVEPAEFEKRITLKREGRATGIWGIGSSDAKFTVSYDKLKLNAYVHSEPIPIPRKDSYFEMTVEPGVRAARGGPGTTNTLTQQIPIPGLFSLQVKSAEIVLTNNERAEAEQVLILETSSTVHENIMNRAVHAWVLPEFDPKQPADKPREKHRWGDPSQIGDDVLRVSTPLKLARIAAEREQTERHAFKFNADVGRYIYVRVDKGVQSSGGYILEHSAASVLTVPEFTKEVRIMYSGSILSLHGERKVPIFARDLAAVRFEIGRVLPDQIQHLVSQTSGVFNQPNFDSERFNQNNLVERFEQIDTLPQLAPGRTQYHAFDAGNYLANTPDQKRGLFLLRVESYDPVKKQPLGQSDSRLILVTDLGVIVKKAADGSQDIFVQSVHSGEPVANASVQVLGRNGIAIVSVATDESGHAVLPTLQNFEREQTPTLYLVRKEGDMSFMPVDRADRRLDFSRFDVGGVENKIDAAELSAFVFSDRGIYRPGDEMNIGLIVKAGDWKRQLAGVPLEAVVTDSRGLIVKRQRIRLSAAGFEEIRYQTRENSPTGTYTAELFIVKDDRADSLLGSTEVKVEEFQPDRLKMTARLSAEVAEGWVSPADLTARVRLQNLFGTPAQNRRVRAEISLTPAYPVFPSQRDYIFYDPLRSKESFKERLPDAKTDLNGEAVFDLNLQRFANATYRLHFTAQGFEAEGGRGVGAETVMMVSSQPYLIGFKADGALDYITKKSRRVVNLIAISPNANRIAAPGLTLARIERRFVSVLTRQESGTYKYESVKKEIKLSEQPLAIPAGGLDYALPSDQPGDYAIVIRNAAGLELNRIEYSVAGEANLTRSLESNAELQLQLSRKDYPAGAEIEMQIRAPYVGSGLITIEREKVYAYRWFTSKAPNSVQKIKLPAGVEGNAYVSVTFVRDINSREIFMSPLSYGVAPFSISTEKRKLKLALDAPALLKPGERLRMKISANKPAKAIVYAVDEGILQVANYKTPDPLAFFFQKKALAVDTRQILDQILPEFKQLLALSAPGGDRGDAFGKHLNPFKRKRDKPVVFWSGIVDVGPNGLELNYTVPDYFNGSIRIMAVAVSDEALGVAERKATVRGDFVISPNAPLFVAPGDEFDVSVGVANNVLGSGENANVLISASASPNLEIVSPAKLQQKIGQMREGVVQFRVRARPVPGPAALEFVTSGAGKSARLTTTLSVRPAVPLLTTLRVGNVRNGVVDVPTPRQMYPQLRTLEAGMSHIPLGLSRALVGYLDNFNYSCTEQLVSQGMPVVVLQRRPEFGYNLPEATRRFTGLIETLRARQNAEGAFGLWASNEIVSEFASVYAVHFLLEARERDFIVAEDLLTNANTWLRQLAAREGAGLADLRVRAYAIYLLTRQGTVTSNYLAALQQQLDRDHGKVWRKDLVAAYMAASQRLMKNSKAADDLIGKMRVGEPQQADYAAYYDGLIYDAQLVYLLSKHFPERLKAMPPDVLNSLVGGIERGTYNTLSSSYIVLALDAYADVVGFAGDGKFTIAEVLRNGSLRALQLPKGLFPRVDFSDQAAKIRFSSASPYTAYYHATQSGYDIGMPSKPLRNGLEVLREYTDLEGKPLKSIRTGDEIEVRVKVRSINGAVLPNIAVVDLLPGGFDVVLSQSRPGAEPEATDEIAEGEEGGEEGSEEEGEPAEPVAPASLSSQKSTWQPDATDIREDRVLLYGTIGPTMQLFVYRIKATSSGAFVVPPAFAEGMYDRTLVARSLAASLKVLPQTNGK